eukprot:m.18084 g.18084  ORF g.18084 m.18084 type:complete len:59 (+) comp11383_c0_seq1:2-178(+)
MIGDRHGLYVPVLVDKIQVVVWRAYVSDLDASNISRCYNLLWDVCGLVQCTRTMMHVL